MQISETQVLKEGNKRKESTENFLVKLLDVSWQRWEVISSEDRQTQTDCAVCQQKYVCRDLSWMRYKCAAGLWPHAFPFKGQGCGEMVGQQALGTSLNFLLGEKCDQDEGALFPELKQISELDKSFFNQKITRKSLIAKKAFI